MKTIRSSEKANLGFGDTRGVAAPGTNVRHANPELRREFGIKPRKGSYHRSTPTILVAVDFMPASLQAVELAFVWAKQLRASILLLHVVDPIYTGGYVNLVNRQRVRQEARCRAFEKINGLAASHANESVPITCVVREGLPEIEILQLAGKMNVNLIVLGRRPKNLLGRWMLGSVSDDTIDLAPCPVVVVNSMASISNR